MQRVVRLAIAVLLSPGAAAAQAFDFEGTAAGFYPSLTYTIGAQTLTVTAVGGPNARVNITTDDRTIPGPLGFTSAIGTDNAFQTPDGFAPLRFSFLRPVASITFLFGDTGGENDTPARIQAFDVGNALLGTFDTPYPAGFGAGASRSLSFGGNGASYFVLSSPAGVGNDDSIHWEIAASQIAVSAVPEPLSIALTATGLAALAAVARVRRRG